MLIFLFTEWGIKEKSSAFALLFSITLSLRAFYLQMVVGVIAKESAVHATIIITVIIIGAVAIRRSSMQHCYTKWCRE